MRSMREVWSMLMTTRDSNAKHQSNPTRTDPSFWHRSSKERSSLGHTAELFAAAKMRDPGASRNAAFMGQHEMAETVCSGRSSLMDSSPPHHCPVKSVRHGRLKQVKRRFASRAEVP